MTTLKLSGNPLSLGSLGKTDPCSESLAVQISRFAKTHKKLTSLSIETADDAAGTSLISLNMPGIRSGRGLCQAGSSCMLSIQTNKPTNGGRKFFICLNRTSLPDRNSPVADEQLGCGCVSGKNGNVSAPGCNALADHHDSTYSTHYRWPSLGIAAATEIAGPVPVLFQLFEQNSSGIVQVKVQRWADQSLCRGNECLAVHFVPPVYAARISCPKSIVAAHSGWLGDIGELLLALVALALAVVCSALARLCASRGHALASFDRPPRPQLLTLLPPQGWCNAERKLKGRQRGMTAEVFVDARGSLQSQLLPRASSKKTASKKTDTAGSDREKSLRRPKSDEKRKKKVAAREDLASPDGFMGADEISFIPSPN